MTDEKLCPDCGRPGGFAQGECATYASCVAATRVECDTLTITRLRAENARLSEEVARLKAERDEAQRRADSSEFRANMADPNWRPGDV